MQLTVKDLLKQDLPPTHADAVMRKKHTIGSIDHQIRHFSDHGTAAVDQIKKLYTVDSKAASQQCDRVLTAVKKVQDALEKCRKELK